MYTIIKIHIGDRYKRYDPYNRTTLYSNYINADVQQETTVVMTLR